MSKNRTYPGWTKVDEAMAAAELAAYEAKEAERAAQPQEQGFETVEEAYAWITANPSEEEGSIVIVEPEDDETEEEELPCERSPDEDLDGTPAWNCDNDHTGCIWNDGNNTCYHPGNSLTPLEDSDEEARM